MSGATALPQVAHPGGKVQTKDCANLHSAVLQTLLVGGKTVVEHGAIPDLDMHGLGREARDAVRRIRAAVQ